MASSKSVSSVDRRQSPGLCSEGVSTAFQPKLTRLTSRLLGNRYHSDIEVDEGDGLVGFSIVGWMELVLMTVSPGFASPACMNHVSHTLFGSLRAGIIRWINDMPQGLYSGYKIHERETETGMAT